MKTNVQTLYLLTFGLVVGAILLMLGHRELVLCLGGLLLCLFPGFLWAIRSRYLTAQTFGWLVLITLVVGLVDFVGSPERYQFQAHRPCFFTAAEFMPVFLQIGFFLLLFVGTFALLDKIMPPAPQGEFWQKGKRREAEAPRSDGKSTRGLHRVEAQRLFFSVLVVVVIVLHLPLNMWMFDRQIGMTGVEAPQLPFKLSGIFTNWAKIVVPAVISGLVIAARSCTPWLAVLLTLYAAILGTGTLSRSAVFLVMLGYLLVAFRDRRWLPFAAGLAGLMVALSCANEARALAHTVLGGVSAAQTFLGLISFFGEVLSSPNLFADLARLPVGILGRFESMQAIWLSSQFNPAAVGGSWAVFWKFVDWQITDLGHQAAHLEFLGYVAPEGVHNVACSALNYALMASGGGFAMLMPFAVYAAVLLLTFERFCRLIWFRWGWPPNLLSGGLVLWTLAYYTAPGFITINQLFGITALLALIVKLSYRKPAVHGHKATPLPKLKRLTIDRQG